MLDYSTLIALIKFGLVGLSGLFVNLFIFKACYTYFHFNVNVCSTVAFFVAAICNYALNSLWTYGGREITAVRYIKYVAANSVGLLVNLAVLNMLLLLFDVGVYWGQLIGVASAAIFNFVMTRKFVFSN
jgi:dolichol-phosphate mannosyltransferase